MDGVPTDGVVNEVPVGTVIDRRYRVDAPIAEGGMATVYRATDTRLDRTVAVKLMRPELAADPVFVTRFIAEAKAVARISHPNVVSVFDQGTDGGRTFLVMEYLPGGTLRDVLGRRGRLTPREALGVLGPVLAGLAAAHRAGIVHRDIKPENVLVSANRQVKVADFGLSRLVDGDANLTRSGVLVGTVSYLAPEQVEHGVADARSDVYAAGILAFEMLTGRKPHTGATPVAVVYKHVHQDVPPPSALVPGIPPAIDRLVLAATNRDPAQRPADAARFLALVQATAAALSPAQLDGGAAQPDDPTQALGGTASSAAGGRLAAGAADAIAAPPAERTGTVDDSAAATTVLAHGSGAATGRAGPERTLVAPAPPLPLPDLGGPPPQPPGHRAGMRRGRRPSRGVLLFTGLLVVILAVVGGVWWYQSDQYTSVPGLRGLDKATAQSKISSAGLHAAFGTPVYSDTVPRDAVISTNPVAGARVKDGSTVTLVLSLGPQPIPVPNVLGMQQDQATATLQQAGFTVDITSQVASAQYPTVGQVAAEDPSDQAAKGSTIHLTVSTGSPTVPNVKGRGVDDARQILTEAGYTNIQVQGGGLFNIGTTVLNQTPAAGSAQPHDVLITLYVWGF